MMVGRAIDLMIDKGVSKPGAPALVVDNLSVIDHRNQLVVNNVSFEVRAGEILAIAGVQGNGQTELTEAIMGLQPRVTGSITLEGRQINGKSVKHILDSGVGFVPEDRTEDGLVAAFSIAENLILDRADRPPFSKFGALQLGYLAEFAQSKLTEFDIRAQGIGTKAGKLSGGNQQKVVLARELSRDLKLLVAAQPTRGLDVGSIEFVHTRIVAARDAGVPVIVVSTELDEVAALADRVAVMYRGAIIGIVPGDTPRDVLGLMMAGETPESAGAAA
jgi:simple sugar transport system ATP-binding protein